MTTSDLTVFCDGGVINRNPSPYGGTFAWCHVVGEKMVRSGSGILLTPSAPFAGGEAEMVQQDTLIMDTISNNVTEMVAAIEGLKTTPENWEGRLCSDSQITVNRLVKDWAWNGIPDSLREKWNELRDTRTVEGVLLSGHPNSRHLSSGIGPRGYPCSKWNVWCDKECQRLARMYLSNLKNPLK